ncbi:MAG: tRNA lysidine(34) synthetase TilS, partial [Desulfatiglandales bacterium]|nr:tRNA lysidine(34) synthetase TilS [Desulfatiglandales bacterium]
MAPIRVTIKKVKETLSRYGMIDPGDLVIVAVSGGPDSVCLLDILHELKAELAVRLVVAHYNHGLRGGEDESETRFVRHLASAMNFPFETENASFFIEGKTASLEERARNARYEFLERLKGKLHAQKIAMGHHLNDQAETVLMRLLRGSGPSGLAGIPPKRDDTIIRPLIELKREEIDSYVKRRELSYRVDRSNFDTRYLRNKIRLELLPLLLEYQPQFVEHLGQLAVILREDDKYLETEAEKW